ARPGVRSEMASLDARELLKSSAFEHFGDVQVADGVGPDAMRAPELAWIVTAFAAKASDHVALQIDDADAVFQFGNVHDTVGAHIQFGRSLETGPHVQIVAVQVEDLDAVVFPVSDVDLSLVLPDRMHSMEKAGFVAGVAQVAGIAWLTP